MKRPMLVFSVTAVVCGALFLIFGAVSAAGICAAAASVSVFFIIKRKRLGKYIIIPAVCCFALASAVFFLIFNTFQIKKAERYEGKNLTVYARIDGIEEYENGTYYTLHTIKINNKKVKLKLDFSESDYKRFELYDCIALEGVSLEPALNADYTPNTSLYFDGIFLRTFGGKAHFVYQCKRTPVYYCCRLKEVCSKRIAMYLDVQREGGLLNGMIFGDKLSLDGTVKSDFQTSGISHLLAVSGLHTSLWCGLLLAVLSLFKAGKKLKTAVCTVFLILFCTVSGFTPSVLRASFMTVCSLCAPLVLRRADSLNSLGLASTLIILKNPFILTSPGFVLSVSATVGVIFAGGIENAFNPTIFKIKPYALARLVRFIISSLIVSAAAGIFTLPACAVFFGVFSIVSPLTNLAAVQPAFYAMLLGAAGLAASLLPLAPAKAAALLLFKLSKAILSYLITAAHFFAGLKYAALPAEKSAVLISAAVIAAVSAAAYYAVKYKKRKATLPIACVLNAAALVLSILLPMTVTFSPCRLTVIPSGNSVCVSLSSGTHFAYLGSGFYKTDAALYLPQTRVQTLDLFAAPEPTDDCVKTYDTVRKTYYPEKTVVYSDVGALLDDYDRTFPSDFKAKNEKFNLTDKISIEIIDSDGLNCAIIKGNKKCVLLLFSQSCALDSAQKRLGIQPDIAVVPEALAENYAAFCGTVIITAGKSDSLARCAAQIKRNCRTVYTAESEAITVVI